MSKLAWISSDWGKGPKREGQSDAEYAAQEPLPGGAGWYRCRLPADALRRAGHEVVHAGGLAVKGGEICPVTWQGKVLDGFDIVVIQRWMHHDAATVFRNARKLGQTVVSDIDDWFWGLDPRNNAFAASHPLVNPKVNVNHYKASLGACSGVIASTPYLADRLRSKVGRTPVRYVRNAIDLERWTPQEVVGHRPVIGWVGAIGYRSGDLETLRGTLGPLVDQHDLHVIHSGAMPTGPRFADLAGVDPKRVTERPLCSILDYPKLFAGIDIGIVPLRDTPFNYAKSAIKSMELSAAGIPFRSAYSPENRWYAPWASAHKPHRPMKLAGLLDPEVRRVERQANLERIAAEDIEKRWMNWESALFEIAHLDSRRR